MRHALHGALTESTVSLVLGNNWRSHTWKVHLTLGSGLIFHDWVQVWDFIHHAFWVGHCTTTLKSCLVTKSLVLIKLKSSNLRIIYLWWLIILLFDLLSLELLILRCFILYNSNLLLLILCWLTHPHKILSWLLLLSHFLIQKSITLVSYHITPLCAHHLLLLRVKIISQYIRKHLVLLGVG